VTRWPARRRDPPPEPLAWVRAFEPERWTEPDEQELLMAGDHGLPEDVRRWHAERRWNAAVNDWYRQHPGADHRLEDLIQRRRWRRAALFDDDG